MLHLVEKLSNIQILLTAVQLTVAVRHFEEQLVGTGTTLKFSLSYQGKRIEIY